MNSPTDVPFPTPVTKEGICSYLGKISAATYDNWQRRGLVPGPVPGTNRYDLRQHDYVLNSKLGIDRVCTPRSALKEWERSHG